MKCSICKEKIIADPYGWEGGCNAQPINDGTCCYKCDNEVVLPRRLEVAQMFLNGIIKGYVNNDIEKLIEDDDPMKETVKLLKLQINEVEGIS